jgi:hypothetical protein
MASPRYDRLHGQEQHVLEALPQPFASRMSRLDDPFATQSVEYSSERFTGYKSLFSKSSFGTVDTESDENARYSDLVSSQNPPSSQTPFKTSNSHETLHLKDWQWEFAASAFSLACFVAVVLVLAIYHNKSLSRWNFVFDISLNTLIALLSTLSRTALLVPVASCISQLKWIHLAHSPRTLRAVQIFDDASRGPWGSLQLIWKLHFRTKLATWGSIITILSLTMGPFAQQLLSYPSRLQFEPGATFYTSQIYDSGTSRSLDDEYAWLRGMFIAYTHRLLLMHCRPQDGPQNARRNIVRTVQLKHTCAIHVPLRKLPLG